jgi:Glyoxalase-like domain
MRRRRMLRIDHVVLAVRDLDAAGTRILKEVGLGSLPGGRHRGWGTENRVVPLGHEYVELLAVADPVEAESSPVETRISNASRSGNRLVALCVSTDRIEGVAERLGLAVTPGSRSLPDVKGAIIQLGPELQVRGSSVVPVWPTGIPPSEQLPGPRGYLAEPSLSGSTHPLTRSAAPAPLKAGEARTDRAPLWSADRPLSAGELAGHRA